jgi:predicted Rossmann fold flavoprotein
VTAIAREAHRFRLDTSAGPLTADRVVLSTGGLSLPKTGSDGWGYQAAAKLGHTIVPTSPALVPMVLAGAEHAEADSVHKRLSGVSQPVEIGIRVAGQPGVRVSGAMLWTHFGVSGPAALDASRHWLRAKLEGRPVRATANLTPAHRFESLEARWIAAARDRPRARVAALAAELMPASVAEAVTAASGVPMDLTLATLSRETRRQLARTLLEWPLNFVDSRGYNYAEVTAGGVDLSEINPATMASRVCPGLLLVGEILDVDGRIGGFNFQWAWATGWVAGRALGPPG